MSELESLPGVVELAPRKEIFSWAMFDFANSGYSTVVATAVYNAFFVSTVAGGPGGLPAGQATLLWTITIAISNAIIVATAPILGCIADFSAGKKRFLLITAVGCAIFTALLGFAGPGQIALAMTLMILANVLYGSGENLIAAFLPEIAPKEMMGRVSAFGWTIGYTGGLLTLGLCLAYVSWAQHQGLSGLQYVPVTMWIVSAIFMIAATPCFLWLKERTQPNVLVADQNYITVGFSRLRETLTHARQYKDLLRFLATLLLYSCGTATVVFLAAVYAQQEMGFTTSGTITLVMVVNVTAAAGAFAFGFLQDKLGSIRTLQITLLLWLVAVLLIFSTHDRQMFWLASNIIGLAMGGSQSAGRALVGVFSPPGRSAEFFGLWGLAVKLASIIGPICYGLIDYATCGNHRMAIISTATFFILGLLMLSTVNEARGQAAASN